MSWFFLGGGPKGGPDLHLGWPRGRHRNEWSTIKSQMGGHGLTGGGGMV